MSDRHNDVCMYVHKYVSTYTHLRVNVMLCGNQAKGVQVSPKASQVSLKAVYVCLKAIEVSPRPSKSAPMVSKSAPRPSESPVWYCNACLRVCHQSYRIYKKRTIDASVVASMVSLQSLQAAHLVCNGIRTLPIPSTCNCITELTLPEQQGAKRRIHGADIVHRPCRCINPTT